jgi:UDP-glucuronate 4-epimerase
MDTILVTGGAGFIGLHLTRRLLETGYRVICVDYLSNTFDTASAWDRISGLAAHPACTLLVQDIRDQAALQQAMERFKVTAVIHLAALAGVRPSLADPYAYVDANINGTLSVLESMRKAGVKKLLFASSSSVYGNGVSVPFREDDAAVHPVSPYAFTKRAGEMLCSNYNTLYAMDVFCFRFFTVYGPGQRPEMAVSAFLRNIIDENPVTMYGDGRSVRDYTYIGDIVDGLLAALPVVRGYDVFNLGSGRIISLKELLAMIERVTGKKATVKRLPDQPGDVSITFASIHRARARFGYAPATSLEDGIAHMYADLIMKRQTGPFAL